MFWQTGMAVSLDTFEEQIRSFSRFYKCVSVREYITARTEGKRAVKRLLVLTFDDGHIDNFETAVPTLQHYGANATFFLIGCHLESERPAPVFLYNIVYDKSSPEEAKSISKKVSRQQLVRAGVEALEMFDGLSMKRPDELNWQAGFISREQARQMESWGFEIGAHGYYHLMPSSLDVKSFGEELFRSKWALRGLVAEIRPGFAFPFGIDSVINGGHLKAIKSAGFLYAATSREGVNTHCTDCFNLRRISMDEVPLYVTMFRLTGIRGRLKTFIQRRRLKINK